MKKLAFLSLMLFFGLAVLQAQVSAPQQAVVNPNAPEITFEKTVHDYGTVPYNGNGNCEFKFTNTGKEPLILTNVRSSCGCTVPSWPREPILPGKSEVIKVEYKTNRPGPINKTVTVTSNAKTATTVLKITGTVENPPANTPTPEKPKTVGQK